jgi:hypothetical protein
MTVAEVPAQRKRYYGHLPGNRFRRGTIAQARFVNDKDPTRTANDDNDQNRTSNDKTCEK